jgi:histidinol dehydrogenase
MFVSPVENHRTREEGTLVYPVYSRRSGGLSVGVNLFPDKKFCTFDCPYCEVFPFKAEAPLAFETLHPALVHALERISEQGATVKDICFSGNGEPTLSPYFSRALESVFAIRKILVPEAAVVVITNATGLLRAPVRELLRGAVETEALVIWLKLHAGTEGWYRLINNSPLAFTDLMEHIKTFVSTTPVIIQTMLCSVNGSPPGSEETAAWENAVVNLAVTGNVRAVHLYGKARPSPGDPLAQAVPDAYLESRSATLKKALAAAGLTVPVQVFT